MKTQHKWETTQRNRLCSQNRSKAKIHLPERKGMGVSSNEEKRSKSEARQKYTPEEDGLPE